MKYGIDTRCQHLADDNKDEIYGAISYPIYQSATFARDRVGGGSGYDYSRLQNPTREHLEKIVASLEEGIDALAFSTGMAAITALMEIFKPGDHIIIDEDLYGGSVRLFHSINVKNGLTFTSVDLSSVDVEDYIQDNTKAIYAETSTNPMMRVSDLEELSKKAKKHELLLIVDNTFPTPINCRPFEWGADIVTHSTTKYMDGHGATLGGAIVDSGKFDWMAHADKYPGLCTPDDSYHGITYAEKFGKEGAFITKCTAQLMRDFGSMQSPQNAFMLNLGLESLHVRMPKHVENGQAVAEFLENHPKVAYVNYSGLPSNKYYERAQKYLPNGGCGVVSFGLKGGREAASAFMKALRLGAIETHVADARTCCLNPATSTHRQMNDEQLKEAGVPAELIRISLGLEDKVDLIADISNALDAIK